jgi:flavin reductase (DIM6/NTAB) family NADH-FMN oxidoreductase RutF
MTAVLPSESDVDSFWQAGMRFATGVSVITMGSGQQVHGATAASYTVVSRRPALISLSLSTSGRLAELIVRRRMFAVSMLSDGQADLARHFANPDRGVGRAQFDGVAWTPGFDAGVPLLDHAVCWVWCEFRRLVPAGDHQLVLAGVTAAKFGGGVPLLYWAGQLHSGVIGEIA